MQQRYYDPAIGRFLSVDPVETNSSTGASFNRFSYTNNNPYAFVDPDGRQSVPVTTAIPKAELTKADKAAIAAGNRGQLLYERGLTFSGNAAAIASYKSTPVVYRRQLSPDAAKLQAASGRTSTEVRAYREPDNSGISILPGFADFADPAQEFSEYHGMKLGRGGDATLYQVIAHEQGHVLDKLNVTPADREQAASDHANSMKKSAPQEIKKELRSR